MNETVTVIVAIICGLGGGLIGTIVSVLWAACAEAKKLQIEFLQSQLRELYGPLHFFCVQNDELVKLCSSYDKAYSNVFDGKTTGDTESHKAMMAEADKTIDVENTYAAKVRGNNKRIAQVIEEKWSFIDEDDREWLAEFLVHHIRSETEFTNKERTLKVPLPVYGEIGDIRSYDSRFTARIGQKWNVKQTELRWLCQPFRVRLRFQQKWNVKQAELRRRLKDDMLEHES